MDEADMQFISTTIRTLHVQWLVDVAEEVHDELESFLPGLI